MCSRIVSKAGSLNLMPVLTPFSFLLGTWSGTGTGKYPTISPFKYHERTTFSAYPDKPYIIYNQKSFAVDEQHHKPIYDKILHVESGYLRVVNMESYNKVELVVADPAGSVQLYEGLVESKHASGEKKLTFLSNNVATTSSAKHVKQVNRIFSFTPGTPDLLHYDLQMKAVGQHLQPHLSATLHRVRASSIFAEPAQITPEELTKERGSFDAIVDVREEREFNNGHIEGAVNIPMGHFMAQYDGKDEKVTSLKDKNIVVYCQGGVRSQIVAEAIKKAGFNVTNLIGGYKAWAAEGNKT
jgi:rhodanese-related sulfurtransferase